jgi:hypothetical protein
MARNEGVQIIRPEVVGAALIQRGWRQGSLLETASAPKSWLTLSHQAEIPREEQDSSSNPTPPGNWNLHHEMLNSNDVLIVASQTCDIQKSSMQEPYIEVIRGFWTSDRSIMHQAGKNSSRLFLMQSRTRSSESKDALVADATVRIQIEKAALLALTPQYGFKENDKVTSAKFSNWLARRYNRPALPDAIVDAIQKPIVKAIDKLPASHNLHPVLDGIDEILFFLRNDSVPFQVDMIFLRDERNDAPYVNDEDAARLGGWIANTLLKGNEAELMDWEILSRKEISVYNYGNAYELPLDYYSSWDESTES